MNIRPIPLSLLNGSLTLLVPDGDGYSEYELTSVRVVRRSEITDRSAVNVRDISELTVYYDCVNSSPADMEFSAGMLLEQDGVRYEIVRAEEFAAQGPHHVRITARKV